MFTPIRIERIKRLLDDGARFMVELPGPISIDLTADILAALDEVPANVIQLEDGRNLFITND